MRGRVKWFSSQKGFGFLVPEGGDKDVFIHHTNIEMEGYRTLSQGDLVEFVMAKDQKGRPQAEKIRLVEEDPPPEEGRKGPRKR